MKCIHNITFHLLVRARSSDADPNCLTGQAFEAILDQIKDRDDVRITFDDGNSSDFEIALPALCNRGLRADFFICAATVGTPGHLDEYQIRTMLGKGMRVGSHGMDHRAWRQLSETDLRRELIEARQMLETICGRLVDTVACPFGSYGRHVLRRLREQGYRTVFTSDRGPAVRDDWFQPRTTVTIRESLSDIEYLLKTRPREPREIVRRLKIAAKRLR